MRTGSLSKFMGLAAAAAALAWASPVAAHAFPEREEPPVGATVHEVPTEVRIWFNAKLEPLFSAVEVKDAQGRTVSGDSRVDPDSLSLIETPLKPLSGGEYHVYWHVVARDGHRTEGDYIFTVKP
jgi:methionine-rich copper-binding protein CopC